MPPKWSTIDSPGIRSLPHPLIPAPTQNSCKVRGCRNPSNGKPYCKKHKFHGGPQKAVITIEQRTHMRSSCCDGACTDGKQHEYGNQYCGTCQEACCWHA